eukprot:87755-Prorocentrum_minimum.AAC.2
MGGTTTGLSHDDSFVEGTVYEGSSAPGALVTAIASGAGGQSISILGLIDGISRTVVLLLSCGEPLADVVGCPSGGMLSQELLPSGSQFHNSASTLVN